MGIPPGEAGPRSPGTGDARVDRALARLDGLAELPVADHPAMFEYVHERLAEALGDLDAGGQASPAGPAGYGGAAGHEDAAGYQDSAGEPGADR